MSKQAENLRPDQIADAIAPALAGYRYTVALGRWYKDTGTGAFKPAPSMDTVIMEQLISLRGQGVIPTRDLVSEVDHILRALLADYQTKG